MRRALLTDLSLVINFSSSNLNAALVDSTATAQTGS